MNRLQLKEYFTPGRIVAGYISYDKVIEFVEVSKEDWYVKVAECNSDGVIIGENRSHCTMPTKQQIKLTKSLNPIQ